MTTLAVDHSTAGAVIGGTLKRDGYKGIVRYAAGFRGNVNITPREASDLKANEIPVAIVLEHEADWLLHPATVPARVTACRAVTRACGLPDGVVYMAADFDATGGGPTSPGSAGDRNMHAILISLEDAATVIGKGNVGFYGSAYAIDWLVVRAPWINFYWDTEAWSHGRPPHPKACLYQRAQSKTIAGVSCDIDVILKANFGQRVAAPKPASGPVGVAHFSGTFDTQTGAWTVRGTAGTFRPGGAHKQASVELQFDPSDGTWRSAPLPFNAPPLGGP